MAKPIGDNLHEMAKPIGDNLHEVAKPIGDNLHEVAKPIGENLHEMAKPTFRENKKNISKCHPLNFVPSMLIISNASWDYTSLFVLLYYRYQDESVDVPSVNWVLLPTSMDNNLITR